MSTVSRATVLLNNSTVWSFVDSRTSKQLVRRLLLMSGKNLQSPNTKTFPHQAVSNTGGRLCLPLQPIFSMHLFVNELFDKCMTENKSITISNCSRVESSDRVKVPVLVFVMSPELKVFQLTLCHVFFLLVHHACHGAILDKALKMSDRHQYLQKSNLST